MRTANITGRLEGNYIDRARRSCRKIDVPTGERVSVRIGDQVYERTVHERRVWRNSGPHTTLARFVIVDGADYVVDC